MTLRDELINALAETRNKLADLKLHGTERMSKNGVKMASWAYREQIKRLRASLESC